MLGWFGFLGFWFWIAGFSCFAVGVGRIRVDII